jgi:hypothetical protein
MAAEAMSIEAATAEFYAAKKAARKGRQAFAASVVSAFVKAMQGALALYLKARDQGVSREDGIRGLEEELRAAWPKGVSKFSPACDSCEDTGYIDRVCWERLRCGREVCAKNPDRQHNYVDICHCVNGDKKRGRAAFTPDDAITAAGRTQKRKSSWTRPGR